MGPPAEPGLLQPPSLLQPQLRSSHDQCRAREGIDSSPPGTRFPFAIKHTLSLIKPGNQSTSSRRKGNSWAALTGMGWEVLLDTVFELCVLLDCSPVAISRMYNCQLRVSYRLVAAGSIQTSKRRWQRGSRAITLTPGVSRRGWGQNWAQKDQTLP